MSPHPSCEIRISASVARNWALIVRGLVRARRGDTEAAGPLAEAWSLAQSTDELMRIGPAAAARAEFAWLNADATEVVEATNSALALAVDRRVPWIAGELACWRWRAGVHDALPAEMLAEPYAFSPSAGTGRVLQSGGASSGAHTKPRSRWPMPTMRVLCVKRMEELQALGARPAAAIVARRLRERGVRRIPRGPQARTVENPAGLTARELEVLALLAEGLRNAQIAERLIVSEKTIDTHVSSILRKLGVRTRGEAVAQATRLGLSPAG